MTMTLRGRTMVAAGVGLLTVALALPSTALGAGTKYVSQSSAEVPGDNDSYDPDVSASGRFVVFTSAAQNFFAGAGNPRTDIFLRDLKKGTTKLISKSFDGGSGNGESARPAISASGRFIAFESFATNILADAGCCSVYLYDRKKQKMRQISKTSGGDARDGWQAAISGDGRFIAFVSDNKGLSPKVKDGTPQVYLHDRVKRRTMLVSRKKNGTAGNGLSEHPAISPDGRYVAYTSRATNLSGKDEGGWEQVFLFDRIKKTSTLMSRNRKGKPGNGDSNHPALSNGAKRVVFNSMARNLSGSDTNKVADAFMRIRSANKTRRVSLNWKGKQLNQGGALTQNTDPDISANGKVVAFESDATNVLKGQAHSGVYDHVYARKLGSGKVKQLSRRSSPGNGDSDEPELSADGAFAAFQSDSTNLKSGSDLNDDTDVFRRGKL